MKISKNKQVIAVVLWFVTSISLASWWIIFSIDQLEKITELLGDASSTIARQQRMLVQEGTFLFFLLFAGGIALLYYILLERKRSNQLRQFFAAFTHDVKTSLASLRLRAEGLEANLESDDKLSKLTKNLVKDTVRLELQLENSLFLSKAEEGRMFMQDIDLDELMKSLTYQWPELKIVWTQGYQLRADRRVLLIVLKNFLQNSLRHGEATEVEISILERENQKVEVLVSDNGKGFAGDFESLGIKMLDSANDVGSGIGLFLSRDLVRQMKGELEFPQVDHGFQAKLILTGAKAS